MINFLPNIMEEVFYMEDDDLKVIITRASGDYQTGCVSVEEIYDVKWDNVSGGVKKHSGSYSLYGYIPYKTAIDCGIKCSGRHDRGDNVAKVCIPKSLNQSAEYREGYRYLLDDAGDKPKSPISMNRPAGQPPCTKKILMLLSHTRGDLRTSLYSDGYRTTTIRNAIRSLTAQGKITLSGSSYSAYQEIHIASSTT